MENKLHFNANNRDQRLVSLKSSPSYILNNLTSNGGEYFAYINNSDATPKCFIYDKTLFEQHNAESVFEIQWKDMSDCMALKYVKIQGKYYLVICTLKNCLLWNYNGSRQLTFIEAKKDKKEGKTFFFTCASEDITEDGEEFIAVGASTGEIFYIGVDGSSFSKDLAFTMKDENSIMAMACDMKSKTLAVGNSNGYIVIFKCESLFEWKPVTTVTPLNEIPVTALSCLNRGDNLFVAGFANG